jgi:hypothetical protein
VKVDLAIGSTSAVMATAIPDAVLAYSGKFLFAIVTSVLASLVSAVVRAWLEKRRARHAHRKHPKKEV